MLFCITIPSSHAQYKISGVITAHQQRYSRAILEYIPDINGLSTIDQNNIINSTTIDENGHYEFTGIDLPKEKLLYRISLQAPRNGITISTGLYKNYISLSAEQNSQIHVSMCSDISKGLKHCTVSGDKESLVLQSIYDDIFDPIFSEFTYSDVQVSTTQEEFIENKLVTDLKHFADTTQYMLPGIVALSYIDNMDEQYGLDPVFYNDFISDWAKVHPENKYLNQFRHKIDIIKYVNLQLTNPTRKTTVFAYILSILLIGALAYIFYLKTKITALKLEFKQEFKSLNFNVLSKKERAVVKLLLEGSSNKEIAQTLFIEISTVKTHVSNIFKKLNISSRQELLKKHVA